MSLKSMFSGPDAARISTYRESVTTFNFISDLMKELAKYNGKMDVLMTKSGDTFGYDVILQCNNKTKYIQLKTTENTNRWKVHNSLIKNPDGELIVIYLSFPDDNSWYFDYRIWDRGRIPFVTEILGETTIKDTMLEQGRSIKELAVYLFRDSL